ncbi:prefoldin alpha-like domain containing protein [Tieghemostelium lacteum]|uniref:Prefoldin subunit 3 n=1 Tax=Tieghemostelium lacteum TaxID=361077 RepID=A0A151Z417_TIELA|nr:prefoldin alpha-like domain containing protein [Tieghemostelium lacteum]|eukprot:KYQ88685.1 prefoldin alpha-like domain containing protein [Tieghemostelium lacteum]
MSEVETNEYSVLFEADIKPTSNIPGVTFISNVEEYLKDKEIESVFRQLQDSYSKFKYFESKLSNNISILTLRSKQLQESLDIVDHVASKTEENFQVQYELSEGVYSSAQVDHPKSIYLWLGANVMLEYSFEEAKQVLRKNKDSVDKQLKDTIQDLGYVKDQITTTDVNVSRVYNYDVLQKRKLKQQQLQGQSNISTTTTTTSTSTPPK